MMQASKKVPFEDPLVLNGVRALYVFSNIIIAGIYIYVKLQIDKKKGMSTFTIYMPLHLCCVGIKVGARD